MHRNRILSALNDSHPNLAHEHLKPFLFESGDLIAELGMDVDRIIFPCSGMIAVVVELGDGDRVEAAMIGREGLLGGACAFGGKTQVSAAIAQLPGSGWSMKPSALIEIAQTDDAIRQMIFQEEQFLLAQAQQSAACNAKHPLPRRLASWLLRAHDATGEDELRLTQESLAQSLGVQRATVSVFAARFQVEGWIRYRRGRVIIRDRAALADEACECYAALRNQYTRLFGPHAATRPGRS